MPIQIQPRVRLRLTPKFNIADETVLAKRSVGQIERMRSLEAALFELSVWPACYPANANIQRMREYAAKALTPPVPANEQPQGQIGGSPEAIP